MIDVTSCSRIFWKIEAVPGEDVLFIPDELKAEQVFQGTFQRADDGRYYVSLPKKDPFLILGQSRTIALKRLRQNVRSFHRKGTWTDFQDAVNNYKDQRHAEEVPADDSSYYLPLH